MKKYTLYIGSNNETGELEYKKAKEIITSYFKGYTTSLVKGMWEGKEEDTLKVEIATLEPEGKVRDLCIQLKNELQQDSIMLDINGEVDFI